MKIIYLFSALIISSNLAWATDLVIDIKGKTQTFKRAELLINSQTVKLQKDPTYSKEMTYDAVSVRELLSGTSVPENAALLFEASDGFRVSIPASKVLSQNSEAQAYLAVENPKKPWPKIKKKKASAGPYYLIWSGEAVAKHIGQEEWPFMVTKIILQKSFEEEYPGLVPQDVRLGSKVYKGYQLFAQNCFACHAVNKVGGEKMGPDLGYPHSPTQYMVKKYFVKLVRNPQSLRAWTNSQMSAFPESVLSDSQIEMIWDYLGHVNKR